MSADPVAVLVEQWLSGLAVTGKPNEWESKQLLRELGIAVPRGMLLAAGSSPETAGDTSILGTPGRAAVKACAGDILHKSDRQGVILDVPESRLPQAVAELRRRFPSTSILVEEMVPYSGAEMIIGALHDSTFGPAVMAGAGGILTELYKDVAFRLAPCTSREAHHLLEELILYPTLNGYRGLSADVQSLAEIVSKVADLAVHLIGEGCQLDINPIVWNRERWIALDAKVVLSRS